MAQLGLLALPAHKAHMGQQARRVLAEPPGRRELAAQLGLLAQLVHRELVALPDPPGRQDQPGPLARRVRSAPRVHKELAERLAHRARAEPSVRLARVALPGHAELRDRRARAEPRDLKEREGLLDRRVHAAQQGQSVLQVHAEHLAPPDHAARPGLAGR